MDLLQLLREALSMQVPAVLLHERMWGSLIGMFELNNLSLSVQSPLEEFFLAADALQGPEGQQVQAATQPLLDALDTEYDTCVEVR